MAVDGRSRMGAGVGSYTILLRAQAKDPEENAREVVFGIVFPLLITPSP